MSGKSTIKRGKPTARIARRPAQTKTRRASFMDRLPVQSETVERVVSRGMFVTVAVAALGIAWMAGVPGYLGTEAAKAAGRAGFQVKRVEVNGVDRMDRLTVYGIALDQHSMAMPLVDLDRVRGRLIEHGWIEDARVSRRLPDTLVVDIVERKPSAIWQNNQKLSLIDEHGVVLERVDPNAMPDLPILVGPDAKQAAGEFGRLVDRAPSLKNRIVSASRIGGRRWDVRFDSGETLALPEGEDAAGEAFIRFARIDGVEGLLGRNFARFDMRNPDRMVIRKVRSETMPAKSGAADDDKTSSTTTDSGETV
ncbi:MAG: cell division protein FtsQ/DivIB [Sphingomonadales bacterium]|jgi:cell division protein FtsQ|nr:cell division protein FtsQ/DivIB [Sphingomonadales bacterium]